MMNIILIYGMAIEIAKTALLKDGHKIMALVFGLGYSAEKFFVSFVISPIVATAFPLEKP